NGEQFSKGGRVHVARRQQSFMGVGALAGIVVVICEHARKSGAGRRIPGGGAGSSGSGRGCHSTSTTTSQQAANDGQHRQCGSRTGKAHLPSLRISCGSEVKRTSSELLGCLHEGFLGEGNNKNNKKRLMFDCV